MAHIDEDKLTLIYEAMYSHPKIGKTATKVYKNGENGDNDIEVIYHSTSIVTVKNGIVTLNNGGWMSSTTKKRMNQTSRAFDLGFYVYQKNNEWLVTIGDETIPFEEDMSFSIKNDSPLTKNLNPTEIG